MLGAISSLHLPSLSIQGLLGIKDLTLSRLGRVTLLAGRNGVGKTTVLDAVRIYAGRGRYRVLDEILTNREEFSRAISEDGKSIGEPDISALFYGREPIADRSIFIGRRGEEPGLRIQPTSVSEEIASSLSRSFPDLPLDDRLRVIQTRFGKEETNIPFLNATNPASARLIDKGTRDLLIHRHHRQYFDEYGRSYAITCESLGPGVVNNFDITRFWDAVVLTPREDLVIRALRLVAGGGVERLAMSGESIASPDGSRRAIVKLKGNDQPVPLRSLGDGALRLFGIGLAIVNSEGGFLLIDEAENGIHYSLQSDYWRMVIQTAHESNVQVVATTHSWDCVRGFAQAATESEDVEGMLIRLERRGEDLRAIEYSEKNLRIAAEQEIEVR